MQTYIILYMFERSVREEIKEIRLPNDNLTKKEQKAHKELTK